MFFRILFFVVQNAGRLELLRSPISVFLSTGGRFFVVSLIFASVNHPCSSEQLPFHNPFAENPVGRKSPFDINGVYMYCSERKPICIRRTSNERKILHTNSVYRSILFIYSEYIFIYFAEKRTVFYVHD